MDKFADIRPYNDSEVPQVLERLLNNGELLTAVCKLKFPRLTPWLGFALKPLIGGVLRRQLAGVNDVAGLQSVIKNYMDHMIATTTSQFSVSGLNELPDSQACLFLSNHRDIALDPGFVNYSHYAHGKDTLRIAIGDNLLTKDYVSDLMRVNKSFIVKRSAKGPRQMLAAYKQLSAYIRFSLQQENASVWIAQREGRAKDGYDQTEPAVIKMLTMSLDKSSETFSGLVNALNFVPVAISYEYDPLDEAKANELYTVETEGNYQKGEQEDVASIAQGIAGQKGAVHVAYGTPLNGEFATPQDVAAEIDRQIIGNYVLHPTNYFAYEALHGNCPEGKYGAQGSPFLLSEQQAGQRQFQDRLQAMPEHLRPYVLRMYACCIERKLELGVL